MASCLNTQWPASTLTTRLAPRAGAFAASIQHRSHWKPLAEQAGTERGPGSPRCTRDCSTAARCSVASAGSSALSSVRSPKRVRSRADLGPSGPEHPGTRRSHHQTLAWTSQIRGILCRIMAKRRNMLRSRPATLHLRYSSLEERRQLLQRPRRADATRRDRRGRAHGKTHRYRRGRDCYQGELRRRLPSPGLPGFRVRVPGRRPTRLPVPAAGSCRAGHRAGGRGRGRLRPLQRASQPLARDPHHLPHRAR